MSVCSSYPHTNLRHITLKFTFLLTVTAMNTTHPIHWFRHCAPYINTHRGKTFVLMFDDSALSDPNFATLVQDIALLHSLGIRLVLVHGSRLQIDKSLALAGEATHFYGDVRITPPHIMPHILGAVGAVRFAIEAQFSKGLANTPLFGAKISTVSGNFISARPFGVRDGIDYQQTGEVRRVETGAISHNLASGHIVIIGSVGFSATGELFNMQAIDVATAVATALTADKLILFSEEDGIYSGGQLVREITLQDGETLYQSTPTPALKNALTACRQGVKRIHLLSHKKDGALIDELFTTDGCGTMLSQNPFDHIRPATTDDIVGIENLIRPLEQQGILIARSRQRLEEELGFFYVIERDGKIIGCSALYPLSPDSGEIASIAIDPDYRSGQRGLDLLTFIEQKAKSLGFSQLFALTTRTLHWFIENGFVQVEPDKLPDERRKRYHNGRNSKVLLKQL